MRVTRLLRNAVGAAVLGLALAVPVYAAEPTGAPAAPGPTAPTPPEPTAAETASQPRSPATATPRTASPLATPLPTPAGEEPDSGKGGGLPVTGAHVGGMVVLGGGLLAAGIAMVAVRRRDLSILTDSD